jgi:cathepsin L
MDNAFNYIKSNNGIDTEPSYPYEARDDTCRFKAANVGATDTVSSLFLKSYEY